MLGKGGLECDCVIERHDWAQQLVACIEELAKTDQQLDFVHVAKTLCFDSLQLSSKNLPRAGLNGLQNEVFIMRKILVKEARHPLLPFKLDMPVK